nr:PREDICTED: uncharacterized protein LOC106707053 [Latimeria chalumnae]|eukprot:XP_014354292.1 PREDICTED: uncharacterized protein LOC106707053 [Latimeria chalumnae]
MQLLEGLPTPFRWRLNSYLLSRDNFVTELRSAVAEFFQFNNVAPPDLACEAFKATIRGTIIAYSTAYKKYLRQQMSDLEIELRRAEMEQYKNNSSELQPVFHWVSQSSVPAWAHVEALASSPLQLDQRLFSLISPGDYQLRAENSITAHTLSVYALAHKFLGWTFSISPHASVWRNPAHFSGFAVWREKGLTQVQHLFHEGVFCSFAELAEKYILPPSHLFRYLQIRHLVSSAQGGALSLPLPSPLESFITQLTAVKGFISKAYSLLRDLLPDFTRNIKAGWERGLGIRLQDCNWLYTCDLLKEVSISSKLRLNHFKVLHCVYYSPSRLHKFDSLISSQYRKCQAQEGTYFHLFWECPYILRFWSQVVDTLSSLLDCSLPARPGSFLLLLLFSGIFLTIPHVKLLRIVLATARNVIAHLWGGDASPTWSMWIRDWLHNMELGRI